MGEMWGFDKGKVNFPQPRAESECQIPTPRSGDRWGFDITHSLFHSQLTSKAPPFGRIYSSIAPASPTPNPHWEGWGITLIAALDIKTMQSTVQLVVTKQI